MTPAELASALAADRSVDLAIAASLAGKLCSDCPPVGYPTDETRCAPCSRSATLIAQAVNAAGGMEET